MSTPTEAHKDIEALAYQVKSVLTLVADTMHPRLSESEDEEDQRLAVHIDFSLDAAGSLCERIASIARGES